MRLAEIWVGILTVLLFSTQSLLAQQAEGRDRGVSSYASFTEAHDSSLGWSTELNSSVAYDFNRSFSVAAGVPLWFVHVDALPTSTTPVTPTQTTSASYLSLDDFYSTLLYRTKVSSFRYSGNVIGTAPTGNTSDGISSGRPTFGCNNRFEYEVSRLTPFAEAGIGSSINVVGTGHGNGQAVRTLRNYTTLGGMSVLRAGTEVDLGNHFSIEGSAYDDLPFGQQKVYSHSVSRKLAHATAKRKNPAPFELNAVTAGSASIDADHGFDVGFDYSPNRRVELAATYDRSLGFSINALTLTVGYRFGHTIEKQP